MSHNERCKECKIRFRELLEKIYGPVKCEHHIQIGTKPEDFREHPRYPVLNEIYTSLQKHRGFTEFVRASYVKVDFFLPEQGMIVEFDESQHFTEPRKIAFSHYPSDLDIGFSLEAWMKHCDEIDAHDNDPPFRDEQRAWYDTMRDFIPEIKGYQPTARLYSRDMEWCMLDPEKSEDVEQFRKILVRTGSKIDVTDDTKLSHNQIPVNPVLDLIIRYEYLANIVKLQYLLDCTNGMFDYRSRYLSNLKEKTKVLNSGGEAFKVYLNRYFRNKGYCGPLFSDRNPKDYESVTELGTANRILKNSISRSNEWFAYFCEFTLIKTSLHELTADVHESENIDKYGYRDLKWLREFEKEPVVSGKNLREFVVHCLNIGVDPSEDHTATEQDVDHLVGCKYAEFQSRREEWIKLAWLLIGRVKAKMNVQGLSGVMRWDAYSPCAYDTGPVFLRKKRELLLPKIARSFETYHKWNQEQLRKNMYEIVGQDVTFVIENYSDHFKGKQTVDFLEGNSNLTFEIKNSGELLNRLYRKICFHLEPPESTITISAGISLITVPPSKKLQESESRIKQNDKKPSDPALQERISKSVGVESGADNIRLIRSPQESWTEFGFLVRLQEMSGSKNKVETAKKLIGWARSQGLDLGEKTPNQSFIPFIGTPPNTQQLFKIKVNGNLVIDFKNINEYPQFASVEKRQQLVSYLNTIKGLNFTISSISDLKFPSYDLVILEDLQNFDAFKTMSTWFFNELRKGKE